MSEFLVHLRLGVDFQAKRNWQENAHVHVQSEHQESCPSSAALKLAQQTATWTPAFGCMSLESIKAQKTELHSGCNTMSATHRGAKGGRTGVRTGLTPSQQAGSLCPHSSVIKSQSSGSRSNVPISGEHTSSQAPHC